MVVENYGYTYSELDKIFKSSKKIFFVGIGGISMSALAEYCIYLGKEVYGYDRERSDVCKKIRTWKKFASSVTMLSTTAAGTKLTISSFSSTPWAYNCPQK